MKFTHLIAALALVVGFAGCKKKEEKTDTSATTEAPKTTDKEAPKAAAKGRKIPNSNGMVVEAPAKWLDNGIGGAAGMHLDADGGMFQIRELEGEEAAMAFADWKKQTEEIMFQKWMSADETPDGFKALYAMDKMKMKGEEMVKDGTAFAFHVKRKVDSKVYYCYGSAATEADAKEGLDICTKFGPG